MRGWTSLHDPHAGGDVVISVVVADDQSLVRAGLSGVLNNSDDIQVVAEVGTGVAAIDAVREQRPDIVVMDIRMPVLDGIEATRRIVNDATLAGTRVLVLTTFGLDEYIFDALRAGASGFLLKDIEAADLRQAIRVVAAGDALLSPAATTRLVAHFTTQAVRRPPDDRILAGLTAREREVMTCVATGLSNEEIGGRLYMSAATARTHVHRAMRKLGARDRAQLVVLAYETGLVTPGQ
jgi:DNA-binding NarL/FixJ family response regulator